MKKVKEKKALYFPSFFEGASHGGKLRTEQIYSKLINSYGETNVIVLDISSNYKKVVKQNIILFLFKLFIGYNLKNTIKTNIRQAIVYVYVNVNLKKYGVSGDILIEQSPGFNLFVAEAVRELGYEYILYPHNIEFCVNGQKLQDDGFSYELVKNSFIYAKRIITISKLDNSIANIFNDKCYIYPYAITGRDDRGYRNVNDCYETKGLLKTGLILGSVKNPPSRKGIEKLILHIENHKDFYSDYQFIVAGYGTEALKSLCTNRVILQGSVSKIELENLYHNSDACFIYQPPTTGWLTRITQMKEYGKPIYINRSYQQAHGNGLFFYDI